MATESWRYMNTLIFNFCPPPRPLPPPLLPPSTHHLPLHSPSSLLLTLYFRIKLNALLPLNKPWTVSAAANDDEFFFFFFSTCVSCVFLPVNVRVNGLEEQEDRKQMEWKDHMHTEEIRVARRNRGKSKQLLQRRAIWCDCLAETC